MRITPKKNNYRKRSIISKVMPQLLLTATVYRDLMIEIVYRNIVMIKIL